MLYNKTPHSGHRRIIDSCESDGAIFAGIEPLHGGHPLMWTPPLQWKDVYC